MDQMIESGGAAHRPLTVGSPVNLREWCPSCGATVNMVTVDEAMTALLRADTFSRLAATKSLHCVEMPRGSLLVCLDSMPGRPRTKKRPGFLLH